MAKKNKTGGKKDFLDRLVARLTEESADLLMSGAGADAVVDLTALSGTDKDDVYRVRKVGEGQGQDPLLPLHKLKEEISGNVIVFASLVPDMFLSPPGETRILRQEAKKVMSAMLGNNVSIVAIYDRRDFIGEGMYEKYGEGRYLVYGAGGEVHISPEPVGKLFDDDWTLGLGDRE